MTLGYIVIITMIVWRPIYTETCPNILCQYDSFMKRHPKMLFFTNFENNKFGEAWIYHNELFKTPVAVKEIINLNDEMEKISHTKYST